MVLNRRERAIALIAGGIAAYSIYREEGSLPEGATLFDLILRTGAGRREARGYGGADRRGLRLRRRTWFIRR